MTHIKRSIVSFALCLAIIFAVAPPSQAAAPTSIHMGCFGVHGRLVCDGFSAPRQAACVFVYRWMVEAAGWQMIAGGVGFSAAGFLADGTIVGIPLGAFLGLIGLSYGFSGSFVVWYADTYFQPGWYCGFV